MKIIVFGGSGYIGSNLVQQLLNRNHSVINVSRRRCNLEKVKNYDFGYDIGKLISEENPDSVIYLSASFDNVNIKENINVNITKPVEILSSLTSENRFIYIGSYWQFGDLKARDIPIDIYSSAKKAMSCFMDYFRHYKGITCSEVVLHGTYGESDNRGKLLDYIVDSIKNNKKIKLTDGYQQLNLVNVNDVCEKLVDIIQSPSERNVKLQVKSSKNYTPRELVDKVEKIANTSAEVEFGALPYRDVELMEIFENPLYMNILVEDSIDSYVERVINES